MPLGLVATTGMLDNVRCLSLLKVVGI